jgi:hypothetical protein
MRIDASNGNVGIGTLSPFYKLEVNGTLGVTGAATFSSTISASNFSGTHSGTSSGTNTGDQTLSGLGGISASYTYYIGTTLNALNRSSAAQTLTGVSIDGNAGTVSDGMYLSPTQTVTGIKNFQSNLGATSGALNSPPLQVYATGGNAAFMSFHRSGNYAVNMGLDSDNVFRIGGWSAAANRLQLDMSGNLTVAGSITASTSITAGTNIIVGGGVSDSAYTRIVNPGGGSFVTTTGSITGAIRIKLPTQGSAMMMTCTVKVYEYTTNKSFTITFGGYRDGANWYNEFCYLDGDNARGELGVRFGVDDAKDCVWIGETSTVWSYPQVFVTDVQLGYAGYNSTWLSGWQVSFVTAFATVNRTQTAYRKLTPLNYNSYAPTLTGTGASGLWGISVTGNAATATALSSGQTNWAGTGVLGNVVGLLAWKHYGNNHVIFDASNSINPSGGACNNTNSTAVWSATYPTLMGWNGSTTYGVRVDSARLADTATNVAYSGLTGTVPTWNQNTTGNAATATSATTATYANYVNSNDSASRNPDVFALPTTDRKVRFDFSTAGSLPGATGNYGGVMTYAPWTGTSASTGDSSYQLAFYNYTGINASGIPGLAIRNGIDSTWNTTWHKLLHSGNYNDYAPTKTGGGASGTWSIVSSQVTINYNNDSNSTYQMLWGSGNSVYGTAGIYCNPASDTIYTYAYRGNGNVGGTGEASWHPAGIYSGGTNWLYGTVYLNGNDISGAGQVYANGWFRNNSNNTGLYSEYTTQHWSSKDNGYWDASSTTSVSSIRFWTGSHIGTLRGYVYATVSNEIGFLDQAGNWVLRCLTGNSYLTGTFTASGDVVAYSDARIKTNVQTIDNALEKVTSLRGVTYNRTDVDDKSEKIGVIAQEIQKVIPQVVNEGDDGMLGVSYGNLAGVFIEAFKEQQAQIEELKKQIAYLVENR